MGLLILSAAACRPADMYRQGKGQYYRPSPYFADERSARLPVPGTIPYVEPGERDERGPLLKADLIRGRERYEIYCTPCHGWTGDGDGLIVQRGYLAPPSLHSAIIQQKTVEHYEDVITRGYGGMPGYASQIPEADRRKIAHYLRVLQFSRQIPASTLPSEVRQKLEEEPR